MKHRNLHLLGMIVFVLPLFLLPQRQTLAATLTASNALELAGAIATANGTPATADTILLTNDIYLETASVSDGLGDTGLPYIESPITIDGQGYTISHVVGAPDYFRLFLVYSGSLTLLNVALDYGNPGNYEGGTIFNISSLNLINTTISNGRAEGSGVGGAIYSLGTLNITNSTFYNNYAANSGGALYIDGGTVTINNSFFSFNTSGSNGGAVFFNSSANTITNSTFNGNIATSGGAIFVGQFGGLNISSSTLNSNTGGSNGGGIRNIGTLNVTNSTFTDNMTGGTGGGISNGVDTFGNATIKNSTFVHNMASLSGTGGGISVVGGSTSVTNSVFRGNSPLNDVCTNASGSNNLTDGLDPITCDDFTVSPTLNINIGGLTNNGGSTSTNPINAATSSAVDVAATASCATAPVSSLDQRGVPRGIDGNGIPTANDCDIGAFEFGGLLRTLQFAAPTSSITPGGVTTMPISISLDAPLEAGYAPITAYIRVSGGTAVAGTNYAPFGVQTVTFNPGDQTKSVTLNLLNTLLTVDRTVIFSFATSSGPGFSGPAHLGTQLSHTLTLKASTANAAPVGYYYGTRDITLTWDDISWATGYEIQVDSDSGFAAPRVYENISLSAGTLSHEVTVPGNGTYYWRVRAKKADGTPAPTYSPTQSFVVAGT